MRGAPDTSAMRRWYGATVLLAAALVVWLLAGPESRRVVYLLGTDLIAAALLVTTSRSVRGGRSIRRATLVGVFALLAVGALRIGIPSIGTFVTSVLLLLVGIAVPVLVVRDIVRRRQVDVELVLAAITIYLLIGLAWSMVFSIAAGMASDPLFTFADGNHADGDYRDHVYVSFVTVSTTGYGDIVPASGTARAIAMMTALTGQLYLVTAVATAVSLFSATRLHVQAPADIADGSPHESAP